MSAARQGHKASDKTIVVIEAANPNTTLDPCLGKERFETAETAIAAGATKGYYHCIWCGGWHMSARGFKGNGKSGRAGKPARAARDQERERADNRARIERRRDRESPHDGLASTFQS
jgi:hypothetical protein